MERKHIASFSGGKDSTAMVLRLIEDGRPLDEIVFFDTGWEFPEMYEHIEQVEAYINRPIVRLHPKWDFWYWATEKPIVRRVGKTRGEIYRYGNSWPSWNKRWCTREKCRVLDSHVGNGIVYLGFASDESGSIKKLRTKKPSARFPLVRLKMSEADCLEFCVARGFDWGGLYDKFARVSCYCCPLQRVGELRILRRDYPELWARMVEMESRMDTNFPVRFKGDKPLSEWGERFRAEDEANH